MPKLRFYFDYIDPASFVMERRIRGIADELDLELDLHPWEIRPPDAPAIAADDPGWVEWWERVTPLATAEGIAPKRPARIPLTRKAHELRLHGLEKDTSARMHERLFRAALAEGRDIARVDVLVALAEECGLDRTETKAVLDVDRFTERIEALRSAGAEEGVRGVPTLVVDGRRMEGVHDDAVIREFIAGSMEPED